MTASPATSSNSRYFAIVAIAAAAFSATAQDYPTKSIRLIVPFGPGGPRDVQARLIGAHLTKVWGQTLIVDNRGGANGIIGTELAARADADGYTLLMISAGFAVNATLYPKLPYDSLRDFAPVAPLSTGPGIVVVTPSLPVKSIAELIDTARTHRIDLFYASSGTGAPSHLAGELFKLMTHVDMTHVPYKGMALAITDVIAGRVQLSIPTIPGALPFARSGRLRALAVTGEKRSPAAPEIPTVAEAGVPGYSATNWYGIAVPARTPRQIIARLNEQLTLALSAADTRERMLDIGMEPATSNSAHFAEFVKSEIGKWAKVVQATGLKPD
jgi:tripartite-type tricarboxylate transporter receptor subunit TctC